MKETVKMLFRHNPPFLPSRKGRGELLAVLFMTALTLVLSGCGYTLHRHAALPFTEIQIGLIENRTFEPKLQDILRRALVDEFQKQGIRVSTSAQHTLSGVVRKFSMVGVAEKKDVITEFQMTVLADFRLSGGKGPAREFRDIAPPFIVTFTGTDDFGTLIANKEAAEEKAMEDLASQIVGALIYQ